MRNPYSKPAASVATFENDIDPDAATFQPAVFSTEGRIGRARFLAYSLGQEILAVVVFVALALVAVPAAGTEQAGLLSLVLAVALNLAFVVITVVAAKRRLNDLDHTGWLALLLLVPLLNVVLLLYILLWPGSAGHNRYGPKPVPNSLVVVLAAIVPVLLAIVAGIAVYSYLQQNPGALADLVQTAR